MEGNSLKFTFVNDASKANKMATITVPVTGATNYESYTITVTVTVNDKTTLWSPLHGQDQTGLQRRRSGAD